MRELTQAEVQAIRKVLAHFLDGGWTEILERLHSDEESDRFYDAIESAHAKLSKAPRAKAA
jgi:hypothetical protein